MVPNRREFLSAAVAPAAAPLAVVSSGVAPVLPRPLSSRSVRAKAWLASPSAGDYLPYWEAWVRLMIALRETEDAANEVLDLDPASYCPPVIDRDPACAKYHREDGPDDITDLQRDAAAVLWNAEAALGLIHCSAPGYYLAEVFRRHGRDPYSLKPIAPQESHP